MVAAGIIRDVIAWDSEMKDAMPCDIVMEDGLITEITGPREAHGDMIFDGMGETVALPGLINAHAHSAMTLLRGLAEELPLMEWLEQKIFPIEDRMTEEHVKIGSELAMLEMLACGTASFVDMYFSMEKMAQAAADSGMRSALIRTTVTDDGHRLREALALADKFDGLYGRTAVALGPHAPYSNKIEDVTEVARIARERGMAVQIHWLETETELKMFRDDFRMTPREYLEQTGLIDAPHLMLAHSVWHPTDDLDILARDNVTVVHNPKSNMKLASGTAPIKEMLAHGVNVALGTDGASSNNRLDMWDEMRTASILHKLIDRDATSVSARDVLRMATSAGAKTGLFGRCGAIRTGYNADIALVDVSGTNYVGMELSSLPEFLVYSGSSRDVVSTIVAGRTLYERGEYKTLDARDIIGRARRARRELTEGRA